MAGVPKIKIILIINLYKRAVSQKYHTENSITIQMTVYIQQIVLLIQYRARLKGSFLLLKIGINNLIAKLSLFFTCKDQNWILYH